MRYIKGTLDLKLCFINVLPDTIFVKQSTVGRRWLNQRHIVHPSLQPLICYVDDRASILMTTERVRLQGEVTVTGSRPKSLW